MPTACVFDRSSSSSPSCFRARAALLVWVAMNPVTLTVGVLCVAYGIATFILRATKPQFFRKLGPMRERFGHGVGTGVHVVGYSIMPLAAGVLFILMGLRGQSLF
jgi:hypothetical protein